MIDAFDKRTENALIQLIATLPPDKGVELLDALEHAAEATGSGWLGLFDEDVPAPPTTQQPRHAAGRGGGAAPAQLFDSSIRHAQAL